MNKENGKEFFQELFEEKLVCSVIPQRPRLKTKTMMKKKGKALQRNMLKNLLRRRQCSRQRRPRRC
jgi:hypothetical protein